MPDTPGSGTSTARAGRQAPTARRLVTASAFALPTLFAATLAVGLARLTPPRSVRSGGSPSSRGSAACGIGAASWSRPRPSSTIARQVATPGLRMGHHLVEVRANRSPSQGLLGPVHRPDFLHPMRPTPPGYAILGDLVRPRPEPPAAGPSRAGSTGRGACWPSPGCSRPSSVWLTRNVLGRGQSPARSRSPYRNPRPGLNGPARAARGGRRAAGRRPSGRSRDGR